ncbi:MFS transporter [Caloranaerobacter sp. DY30410]|uniref:MFS transporter n=1 Tax=Caloranaerobacter sp. DY30410 TaxID=3238305 RepID=UPI003D05FC24
MNELKALKKPLYFISFPSAFLSFILPIYALELGSTPIEIGILYSIFSLLAILMRPIVGKWIDKKGRKNGLLIAFGFFIITSLIFLISKNYKYLFAARILQSIANSFLIISLDAMVSDVSNLENKGKNFGIISQYQNRGAFVGSTIGFIIFFNGAFDNPFAYIFGIYLLAATYALFLGIRDIKETLKVQNITVNKEENIEKEFYKYILIMGILAGIESIITPVFMLYLKENITSNLMLISFIFIPGAILSITLPSKLGKLADNFGRKKLMIVGLLLQSLFIAIIPITKGYYTFMILDIFITISQLLISPAIKALVSEITGGIFNGKAYGIYHLSVGIGGIIGPLLGGYIYQNINKNFPFYLQGIALIIISIIIVFSVKEKNK